MMLNKWCLICCFLKWHQTVWIRPFLLINCSMNNDVQLLITNWTEASGNTQYHIKCIHRLYYTEHSRKTFGNQLVMFLLACMFKWTFKTVLLPCILRILRYYLMDDTTGVSCNPNIYIYIYIHTHISAWKFRSEFVLKNNTLLLYKFSKEFRIWNAFKKISQDCPGFLGSNSVVVTETLSV